ncbi:MAG: glucokinase [Thermodesulfobacteriota bacterium]
MSQTETILAGDLGGTKTLLALYRERQERFALLRESVYPSRAHANFEEILDAFLAEGPPEKIDAACFDVAGPVSEGRVRTTNLPWTLDERALAGKLGTPRVKLLNDLEATAYGMLSLPADDLVVLHPGRTPARKGHIAVIAAGTGLGEAYLFFDGTRHHPMASEGGHADFAPRNELEIGLLRHLRDKLKEHVSYERVLSGPGLHAIYEFLRDTGFAPAPDWLENEIASGDPGAAISQAALTRGEPLASRALDMFCELYGAEAGNMALRGLTFGGVYVGGGIGPKILPRLREAFPRGYLDKGRFRHLVEDIPVHLTLEPRTALLGAAHYALRL